MPLEDLVTRHYGHPTLESAIREGLRRAGKDLQAGLRPEDLAPVDEFHIGGRPATEALTDQLGLGPDSHLLDIGCGLGGPARTAAARHGCRVSGIDLSEDYVRTAAALTRLVGLEDRTDWHHGSALALPWPAAHFDAAMTIHVGMNIADKDRLFAEAARVLRPGARFGVYDVMRTDAGEKALRFPVPWATDASTSFVEPPARYRAGLERAGFRVVAERDLRALAEAFFARLRAAAADGPPPLGLHLLMGATAGDKVGNMIANIAAGLVAPFEIIVEREA